MPSPSKDSHIMQVRVPKPLWERFTKACHRANATPSESIREFMRSLGREESEVIEALNSAEKALLDGSRSADKASPTNIGREQWQKLRTGAIEEWDAQETGDSIK